MRGKVQRIPSGLFQSTPARVRGTRQQGLPQIIELRFIPACAGNAYMDGAESYRETVHPRVCGERT